MSDQEHASLDIDEGAEKIFGLLGDDQPADEADTGGDEEVNPAEGESEGDLDEDSEVEGDEPEIDEDEDEDPEGEADPDEVDEDDEDEDSSEPVDGDQLFTVKVDGETMEVTLDEALRGYMRQEAFTRKTQATAEQRKAVEAEIESFRSERDAVVQRFQEAAAVIQAMSPPEPDWNKVQTQDPTAMKQFAAWQAHQQKIQSVKQTVQDALFAQAQEMENTNKAQLEREAEKLQSAIPEWVDDTVATVERQKLSRYAMQTYGYTPDDLGSIVDHRAVVVLRKAMLYDDMMARKDGSRPKPKKSKNLKPGSTKPRSDGKKKSASKARERLSRSGSVDDAAELFFGLLD
jgi:hypothetical protein